MKLQYDKHQSATFNLLTWSVFHFI